MKQAFHIVSDLRCNMVCFILNNDWFYQCLSVEKWINICTIMYILKLEGQNWETAVQWRNENWNFGFVKIYPS